jgi:hypothetical protein
MRRISYVVSLGIAIATSLTVGLSAAPASAHAIIDLDGVTAVAGKSSAMTLEIQHGCLPAEATTQVEAFVGRPWRSVKPGAVPGWQVSVQKVTQGGWHITWQNLGKPIPFGTPTFFPITVGWPSKPGTYAMHVTQQCTNGTSYDWNEQYGPATADTPSPPLTPRPEVHVAARAK